GAWANRSNPHSPAAARRPPPHPRGWPTPPTNPPPPAWKATYRRWRPPVERGIAWLTAKGNRRLRYLGTLKNDTWLHNRAAALNLRRLVNLGLEPTANGTWTLAPATP